jgi:dCMP deaminase
MIEFNSRNLLRRAYVAALNSPDPSTQNGALLVAPDGQVLLDAWNDFPKGVKQTPERWERPLKYKIIEHAERNVIYAAAREGIATEGTTMVCAWAACPDCARAIIQAGVVKLVTHQQAFDRSPSFWSTEIAVAFEMLNEAGVGIEWFDGEIGGIDRPLLHTGQLWRP